MALVKRFEVWLVNLDPTVGSEIQKTRPCVIISPNEMNHSKLQTIIIAPMTTTQRSYPTRIDLLFEQKQGQMALDQLRSIDKIRLVKRLGTLKTTEQKAVIQCLLTLFAD